MKRGIHSSEPVEEGVRIQDNRYYFDCTYNAPADLIDVVEPQLYTTIRDFRKLGQINDNCNSYVCTLIRS